MRPVCLIIRDGWGYSRDPRGNAVFGAATPIMDRLKARYPWTLLDCSGEPVGLPDGYQGSSEVGHLNMGAGRVVIQELKRIDDGLRMGAFFEAPLWRRMVDAWAKNDSRFHLLGLLQDEGVHAHQEHLFKIMRRLRRERPEGKLVVHPFLDGRDTPPRSCREYLAKLAGVMNDIGGCSVGAIMGRYYGMDRSRNWALTDLAYHALVSAECPVIDDPAAEVERAYRDDRTPDGTPMVDEYLSPRVMRGYAGMADGDVMLHTNYRQDRAIQLSQAFVDPAYPGKLKKRVDILYAGFTRYWDEFTPYLLGAMDEGGGMDQLLGEVISRAGLRQLRLAETQKFRHVTSFFNGKATTPYPGEDQVEIKGRFDPASFASHPEMDAENVTAEFLRRMEPGAGDYHFMVVNYANGDMVGHTGDYGAARRAVEIVDDCVGRLVVRLLEMDAHILITSDHGNCEQMIDPDTGLVKTSHTLFPVECIYVAGDSPTRTLVPRGKLSDLAPTCLHFLGLPVPPEMTASMLLA